MKKELFVDAFVKAVPEAIVNHYTPDFESILERITDYQASKDKTELNSFDTNTNVENTALTTAFGEMIYENLDKSYSAEEIMNKVDAIAESNTMLVTCLASVENFADKTGEFSTQIKISRRLLQNTMSFILYLLSQITVLGSDLEKQLNDKSDTQLIPYGFDE